jgi:hypothetical protein
VSQTYVHMHACMHAFMHPSIHPYIHTYMHTYKNTNIMHVYREMNYPENTQ